MKTWFRTHLTLIFSLLAIVCSASQFYFFVVRNTAAPEEKLGAGFPSGVDVSSISRPTKQNQRVCGSSDAATTWCDASTGGSTSLPSGATINLIAGVGVTYPPTAGWVNQGTVHDTWNFSGVGSTVTASTINGVPAMSFALSGSNHGDFVSANTSASYVTSTTYEAAVVFQYVGSSTYADYSHVPAIVMDEGFQWGINTSLVSGSTTQTQVFAEMVPAQGPPPTFGAIPVVQGALGSASNAHLVTVLYQNGTLTVQLDGASYTTMQNVPPMTLTNIVEVGINSVSTLSSYTGLLGQIVVWPTIVDSFAVNSALASEWNLPAPTIRIPSYPAVVSPLTLDGGILALNTADAGEVLTMVSGQWKGAPVPGQILSCVGTGSTTCSITGTALHVASTAADAGSGGSAAWVVDEDCDLTAQTTQALATDGNYTFCSQTWTKGNSANETTHAVITNGTGLVLTPSSATNIAGSTWTAPYLHLPFSSYVTGLTATTPVRASIWVSSDNAAANDDETLWGLEVGMPTISSTYGYNVEGIFGYSGAVHGWAIQGNQGGTNTIDSYAAPPAANRVGVMTFPAGLVAGVQTVMSGTTYSAGWPSAGSLSLVAGPGQIAVVSSAHLELANATTGALGISGLHFFLAAMRNGSSTSYVTTIARFRIEHMPPTN